MLVSDRVHIEATLDDRVTYILQVHGNLLGNRWYAQKLPESFSFLPWSVFFSSQNYSSISFLLRTTPTFFSSQDYSYICADPEALKATLRRLDRLAGKKVVITNIFHCLVYLTKSQESFWFCFETLRGASNLFWNVMRGWIHSSRQVDSWRKLVDEGQFEQLVMINFSNVTELVEFLIQIKCLMQLKNLRTAIANVVWRWETWWLTTMTVATESQGSIISFNPNGNFTFFLEEKLLKFFTYLVALFWIRYCFFFFKHWQASEESNIFLF